MNARQRVSVDEMRAGHIGHITHCSHRERLNSNASGKWRAKTSFSAQEDYS